MEGLSKTQIKKALKKERIQDKYRKQKEAKKHKKESIEHVQVIGEERKEHVQLILGESTEGIRAIRQERNAMFRADFESQCEAGPVVVIDCDWGEAMSEREKLSLTQQIMYSYSAIKKSEKPVRLWIVGASEHQIDLIRKLPGSNTWHVFVTTKKLHDLGQEMRSAVYLTADTEDVLELDSVNSDSVLIIGGIVDRNRFKNATLNKAVSLGLKCAQLPIGEFMPLKTSKVLTVNHVVEILVHALDDQDWKSALDKVIPDRKRDAPGSGTS